MKERTFDFYSRKSTFEPGVGLNTALRSMTFAGMRKQIFGTFSLQHVANES